MIETKWFLSYLRNPNAHFRLFCFHHSGGAASFYHPLLQQLSPKIELVAVQLPGRENRFLEPVNKNLPDIITHLNNEFQLFNNKPFLVFGHSLGSILAFEFVMSIQKCYGILPKHLFVSSCRAPHLALSRAKISKLPREELINELKKYNGVDNLISQNDEVLDMFLPIIRNDFSIAEEYQFNGKVSFGCDITALCGQEDQTVQQDEITGWSCYTSRRFNILSLPGGHFYLKDPVNRVEIIRYINQVVDNPSNIQIIVS